MNVWGEISTSGQIVSTLIGSCQRNDDAWLKFCGTNTHTHTLSETKKDDFVAVVDDAVIAVSRMYVEIDNDSLERTKKYTELLREVLENIDGCEPAG